MKMLLIALLVNTFNLYCMEPKHESDQSNIGSSPLMNIDADGHVIPDGKCLEKQAVTILQKKEEEILREIQDMQHPSSPKSPQEKEYYARVQRAHENNNLYGHHAQNRQHRLEKDPHCLASLHKQATNKEQQLQTLWLILKQIDDNQMALHEDDQPMLLSPLSSPSFVRAKKGGLRKNTM